MIIEMRSLKTFVSQYPVTARDLKRILLISMAMAAFDVAQSYWMQRVQVNPWSEVNLLPLSFFKHGAIGYLAWFPVEGFFTFLTLSLAWALASWVFRDRTWKLK